MRGKRKTIVGEIPTIDFRDDKNGCGIFKMFFKIIIYSILTTYTVLSPNEYRIL